jgi:hypothetical protein
MLATVGGVQSDDAEIVFPDVAVVSENDEVVAPKSWAHAKSATTTAKKPGRNLDLTTLGSAAAVGS